MLLSHTLCILLFTALEVVKGDTYSSYNAYERIPGFIKSRISQRNVQTKPVNDSQLTRHLIPTPNPKETIGDYFDKYATVLDEESNKSQISEVPESQITERNLIRRTGYLGSLWSGPQEVYNISLSRCIQFADTIGTWTNANGITTENATLESINGDLRIPFTSASDLSAHLSSRLLDNAAQAVSEAEAFLNSTVCNSTITNLASPSTSPLPLPEDSALASKDASWPDMTHDELRRLLSNDVAHALDARFIAIDGYWTAVLMSMSAGAGVGGALYKGFYNRNATSENVAIVCFTAAGLIFARGIIERLYMTGTMRFIEASVISAFTAWFRQAVAIVAGLQNNMRQISSDNQMSDCLEEIVIDSSEDSLPGYSQPQAGIIELVPMGGLCPG